MKLSVSISSIVLLALLLGCSTAPKADYDLVDLIDATGTITMDGEPLSDAVVTFDAPDGQFSYGMTNSSGQYTLQFDTVKKGVTPGPKTVRISTTRKILGLNIDEEVGEASEEGGEGAVKKPNTTELIPAKYNKQSELKVEVTHEETVYDFDLTSR